MPEIILPLPKGAVKKHPLCNFKNEFDAYRFACGHVGEFRMNEFLKFSSTMLLMQTMDVTEEKFLREYLWCVYVAGFSAATISKKYDDLLDAHNISLKNGAAIPICDPTLIAPGSPAFDKILAIFGNRSKATAVQEVRQMIHNMGWVHFWNEYVKGLLPQNLMKLPNMGPALSCHLARNLGNLDVCKPDVHLRRLAERYKYEDVPTLCRTLNPNTYVGIVDLLLWLACVDHGTKEEA